MDLKRKVQINLRGEGQGKTKIIKRREQDRESGMGKKREWRIRIQES
jgi:hypothetical protein